MYLIKNANIVMEDRILEGCDILIKEDKIACIALSGQIENTAAQVIDASGGYAMPGFIDIHSDYIENMAAPRPTCLMDFNLSIRETEKELVSHGITTIFHSLALYKTTEFINKPIREAKNVRKFIDIVEMTRSGNHLMRHRFHARLEIDNIEDVNGLKQYIEEKKVHLLSFMDHTPGQGQYRDLEVYRETVKGYGDFTDEQIDGIISRHMKKQKITVDTLCELASIAVENGVHVASHDDDSIEKLEIVKGFGASISEFPITMEIAIEAKKRGMFTMAGAPNILLGGSHSGNLSAAEAIKNGCIDILCSDYYPPSLLHAVFKMNRQYDMDIPSVVRLVTLNAAKAVGMDDEIGSIRDGKKADIIIVEKIEDDFPVITAVLVDGRLVQKTNYFV